MGSVGIEEGSGDSLSPLPAKPKVSAIVDRLTSAIAAGEFLPGTRLPTERSLAESLSVGRSTVRKALKELSDSGLVETRLGRFGGTFVLSVDIGSTKESLRRVFGEDLASLRSALDAIGIGYAMAAETAAFRRTDEDLALIGSRLDDFRAAVEGGDRVQAQYADSQFHSSIIDATQQPLLHEVIHALDRKVNLSAPLHFWGSDIDAFDYRALNEHAEILDAIAKGERRRAFDLSYCHAQMDLEIIDSILKS